MRNLPLGSFRASRAIRTIGVIDGPNMSQLGKRNAKKYGTIGRDDFNAQLREWADGLGAELVLLVSNHDGEILEFIHANADVVDGWIVNPAGWQIYAEPVRHALEMTGKPNAETHFANTVTHFAHAQPHVRVESGLTGTALSLTMGLRQYSYLTSLIGLLNVIDAQQEPASA
ncbi:3-dehydroquinate dehydratase [Raineyella antarctica]|uniref:3-dehydroquinate dehydratase n=1 Tax=Raineyella antarctica TaxID=1577474 RepID=A0A1G6GL16_9ACTN|nr:type II 3-dehydroquinate dehydratase [Raineyella antarctica]SDB81856.1 3-dehydroquinate dehydratase [Raineyella antarctica]